MKWVTKKEVKAAGKKSKRAAIRCSIKHWEQLAEATDDEIRRKMKTLRNKSGLVTCDYCALCQRYHDPKHYCHKCPLAKAGHFCVPGSQWDRASDEIYPDGGKRFETKRLVEILRSLL